MSFGDTPKYKVDTNIFGIVMEGADSFGMDEYENAPNNTIITTRI